MNKRKENVLLFLVILLVVLNVLLVVLNVTILKYCQSDGSSGSTPDTTAPVTDNQLSQSDKSYTNPGSKSGADITEDGQYSSKDEVARYIKEYGHLPSNYVTKKKAREAGWDGGPLDDFFPGCSLGGDVFKNREGLLPRASGRTYYECDIDSLGKQSRGAKRIVYSNDGLIYYSDDHYRSFTLLYGKEN